MDIVKTREIGGTSNKQRLIHTYLTILTDHNEGFNISRNEMIRQLKSNFNFGVTMEDLHTYFEPNIAEDAIDIEQQLKNLGIRYD